MRVRAAGAVRSVVLSQSLLLAGVVAMYVGGVVRFTETPGPGRGPRIDFVGVLAAVLLLAAVGAALTCRTAVRWLGASLVALDALMIAALFTDEDFELTWTGPSDTGVTLFALVLLGFVAVLLLTLPGWWRSVLYLVLLVVAMAVAFQRGTASAETDCATGTGCDLAALSGAVWSAIVYLAGLVTVVVIEGGLGVLRHSRRRRPVDEAA